MKKINKFFNFGSEKPDYLVILLHGYGSNGEDLIALAPELEKYVKNPHFIAPNAPLELLHPYLPSYQWFELDNRDPQVLYPQIINSNNILDNFISEQLEKFNLGRSKLILAGFSQGAMMSLYNSTRSKDGVAGVVSFSGKFVNPVDLGENINFKPNVCLIHGNKDEVLDFENFITAKEELNKLEIKFEDHEIDGLGHSIDLRSLKKAQDFLQKITSN